MLMTEYGELTSRNLPGKDKGAEPARPLRDWSRITGRGAKNGNVKFHPYEKGGGRKRF